MKNNCRLQGLRIRDALIDIELGGQIVSESELTIVLSLPFGWIFRFECERFSDLAWTTSIAPPVNGGWAIEGFSIPLLMQAFKNLLGKEYGSPTIDNQIRFLSSERLRIFENPEYYQEEYSRLNDVIP